MKIKQNGDTGASAGPEPLYVYKVSTKSLFGTILWTGAMIVLIDISGVWATPISAAIALAINLCLVAVIVYAYLKIRRVEFYNNYVRLFSNGLTGRTTLDKRYSELEIAWKENRGRTTCLLSTTGNDGSKKCWTVSDINSKKINKPLFEWLKAKTENLVK